ncbi:MAG TPA: ATP-binding protein [Phycisphaerae bacterium]|nr:ATP-binding protein [Phycisphaerae bacterium]
MAKKELTISLAAKCQLLFGFAVLVIIIGALAVPWLRMEQLAGREPVYGARIAADMALRWLHSNAAIRPGSISGSLSFDPKLWNRSSLANLNYPPPVVVPLAAPGVSPANADPITVQAVNIFSTDPMSNEYGVVANVFSREPVYQYAAPVRASQNCLTCHGEWNSFYSAAYKQLPVAALAASAPTTGPSTRPANAQDEFLAVLHPLVAVVRVDMPVHQDQEQLLINRLVIIVSGLIGGCLAIVVFYLITTRLILQPVRVLRNTAEKVAQGDLNIRSAISTGDEFQQLSDTFNAMLVTLKTSHDQLEATNRSLDYRVGELSQRNIDLYQDNRLKTEFLTNVSHELRTPLNAIIGFADLLAGNDAVSQDQRMARYVENIRVSARQLLDLINDLLDLAKIEAGKLVLRAERINVPDVCESLINFMKPLAQKKNIDLTLIVDGTIPLITTDPARFQQILYNFLSNAVKFTPQGGQVRITVALADEEMIRVSVTDTGPGIAPEHHKEIFEKFRQLDASVTRQHGGTGLGLTISKELAEMLGGRLELVSVVGQGTTFSLIMPLKPSVKTPS